MAEYIQEASVNLSQDNLPVYYKYRYTFPVKTTSEERTDTFKHIFKYIKQHYALGDKVIGGLEEYTKGMVATKPHCHIHFISKHKGDTIRKGLMRQFDMIGRCQSCKAEVLVDEGKFWRYPLKQQDGETKRVVLSSGFDSDWLKTQRDIAYACWKQSAEIAIAKVEKKLERTSKERLFAYLDSSDFKFIDLRNSYARAYDYFSEHEESCCVKTIDGYVNIYLLQKKHITSLQLYDLTHK